MSSQSQQQVASIVEQTTEHPSETAACLQPGSNAAEGEALGLAQGPMSDAEAQALAAAILEDLDAVEAIAEAMGDAPLDMVFDGQGADAEALADAADGPVCPGESEFATTAKDMFPTLDAEGDGYLSAADLDAALMDPNLSPSQAAAVATMKKMRDELEEIADDEFGDENDGITMQDLLHYQRSCEVPKELRDKIEGRYRRSKSRVENASDELFAEEIPDVEAMKQGAIGDCWFLAALGSVAAQDPGAVVDMIEDHGDGTYTVTFPNGDSATVDKPTPGEIALYATSGADGTWATVLEKAYGKVVNDDAWSPEAIDQDALDGGQPASDGTNVFSTDGESDLDTLSLTGKEDTRRKLDSAFREGRAVTAQIRRAVPFTDKRREGLPMSHVYSVTDYDPATGLVTLRNPWGHGEHGDDGHDDGVFTLTVEEFDRLYTTASYGNSSYER